MSATDKAKYTFDDLTGKAEEQFGEVTDDREKQNEGKADRKRREFGPIYGDPDQLGFVDLE